mmetsp:Transcript_29742/g.34096  ORF Transcript_29742/g.34096 Transcript_29742/m.34096 type:complete len:207 (-) Transcript_29742:345-965(-)
MFFFPLLLNLCHLLHNFFVLLVSHSLQIVLSLDTLHLLHFKNLILSLLPNDCNLILKLPPHLISFLLICASTLTLVFSASAAFLTSCISFSCLLATAFSQSFSFLSIALSAACSLCLSSSSSAHLSLSRSSASLSTSPAARCLPAAPLSRSSSALYFCRATSRRVWFTCFFCESSDLRYLSWADFSAASSSLSYGSEESLPFLCFL